jgi:hypothetical protein
MLILQLEMMESQFAANDGHATPQQLEAYQRSANSIRRLVESLGLNNGRKARDVTPSLGDILRAGARRGREETAP